MFLGHGEKYPNSPQQHAQCHQSHARKELQHDYLQPRDGWRGGRAERRRRAGRAFDVVGQAEREEISSIEVESGVVVVGVRISRLEQADADLQGRWWRGGSVPGTRVKNEEHRGDFLREPSKELQFKLDGFSWQEMEPFFKSIGRLSNLPSANVCRVQ